MFGRHFFSAFIELFGPIPEKFSTLDLGLLRCGRLAQKMRVFHVPEGRLDEVLCAVAQHDLFIGPVGVAGKQKRLAQMRAHQAGQGGGVGAIAQGRHLAPSHLAIHERLEELPA